ncbi:DUF4338 domain-containing protein [Burkholderia pseudomallei]|uniref:Druantia anti-phage system protein DruA n=1 Tax=Burkholderia pseudomallei TaxID=28450 RepID=UPI000538248B|nr:Druantia anti-phage system protein DruA [Burkholderia pseudomallei]KGV74617.1 hypothetical protein X890_2252 [Burkholderia pseudomallei MSHR4299]MBM5652595.1 DUF4338 domain-containing protein [Burkholderia pseudomallei]
MSIKPASKAFSIEGRIKRRLRAHLSDLGFQRADDGSLVLPDAGKDTVRALHRQQRLEILARNACFLDAHMPALQSYFASGEEVVVDKIKPVLQRISADTWESNLFRLASLTWSVPVSAGFGRRMRYLVWDEFNGKLIGIAAIGDPVYNLSVRDNLIEWSVADRAERLVCLMDAYVLGAVPPYNALLGGKLVASLLRTRDVYDDFKSSYGGTTGIISGRHKQARLLAITTSSSMGRSSVYNRLKLNGTTYFRPIGYTGGWGHFHIPDDLFEEMRDYLRSMQHDYADFHAFGQGPNWRLRTIRAALNALGFKQDMLKHGIQREVFLCEMAQNSLQILAGEQKRPNLRTLLTAEEVGQAAIERWMVGRAQRMPEFRQWRNDDLLSVIHAVTHCDYVKSTSTSLKARRK